MEKRALPKGTKIFHEGFVGAGTAEAEAAGAETGDDFEALIVAEPVLVQRLFHEAQSAGDLKVEAAGLGAGGLVVDDGDGGQLGGEQDDADLAGLKGGGESFEVGFEQFHRSRGLDVQMGGDERGVEIPLATAAAFVTDVGRGDEAKLSRQPFQKVIQLATMAEVENC